MLLSTCSGGIISERRIKATPSLTRLMMMSSLWLYGHCVAAAAAAASAAAAATAVVVEYRPTAAAAVTVQANLP